jgi:hypothetical protein
MRAEAFIDRHRECRGTRPRQGEMRVVHLHLRGELGEFFHEQRVAIRRYRIEWAPYRAGQVRISNDSRCTHATAACRCSDAGALRDR